MAAPSPAAAADNSLFPNGDFETDANGDSWPDHWPRPDGTTWEVEDGNHFLRLTPTEPNKMMTVYRMVRVKPEHKTFTFSFRVRYNDVKRGQENWHDARIILDFKNADGKKLKPSPKHPNFKGTSDGWVERTIEFPVPEGAETLEIMPALFYIQSGQVDLDDLKLTPGGSEAKAESMIEASAAAAAAAAYSTRVVPPPPADKLPPELKVVGNQIQTVSGEPVWLQGLAIPSLEWSISGEHILKSVEVAIDEWKANVIRLPVKDAQWFGQKEGQKDGGEAYRQLVTSVINYASGKGVYVVLDLHQYRAPKPEHAVFWKSAAELYKNHPAVLFELVNEPHDISWEVWRNGGIVESKKKADTDALSENKEQITRFASIGMQGLLDTVRATGANNIVIVGGLDWGYDLSGILEGYALDDRGGNGIVYSSHVYPWKSKWQERFLDVAAKHPVFIGECGAPLERMSFIPPERHEDPYVWVPDFLAVIQKHKLHWTGWSFHPKASPVLIENWDYKPTPYWGAFAKRALAGEQFELKKMR